MKVLHINTLSNGGAAKACQRLNRGLKGLGIDSKILTLDNFLGLSASKGTMLRRQVLQRVQNFLLKGRNRNLEMFSFARTAYEIEKTKEYQEADIVNLHWTALMLNWPSFFKDKNKKIVWTLHDMNPFTGGCHYAGKCKKYLIGCDVCPQLSGTINPKLSGGIFDDKLKALKNVEMMTVISPSNWVAGLAEKSKLLGKFNHLVIPNSADAKIYQAHDKKEAKKKLGLPENKQILLFVSESVGNERKGYQLSIEALKKIDTKDKLLLAVGAEPENKPKNLPIVYLGKVSDESKMSLIYSAADVFVIPSVEDNLPNTVIESLMCGTPVVGFPIGGIVDMVIPGLNGWLVKNVSVDELAKIIKKALVDHKDLDRTKIRREAIKDYDLPVQAKRYLELYKSL